MASSPDISCYRGIVILATVESLHDRIMLYIVFFVSSGCW